MKKLTSIVGLSILIFLLNLFLKSVFITSIPPLLTNDETYYATEALFLIASGSDVTGNWRPWHLSPANPLYSELTGLTYALGFLLFPHNTQLAMKVVPVIFGSLLPVLMGLVMYKLFKRKLFFVVTALLATFNPWLFQFSRMSFDSLASVFFYFLGIVGILYLRGWKVLLAVIPFFLGFFQYQGHKPLLVPLVLITVAYCILDQERKNRTFASKSSLRSITWKKYVPYFVVMSFVVVLVMGYLIRLPHLSANSRIAEFAINESGIGTQVDMNRRLSFTTPVLTMFENKITVMAQQTVHRFLASFNIVWLFFHGNDNVDTFAVTRFGFLYVFDIIFIIFGFIMLWGNRRWWLPAGYLTTFVLIGVLPNVIKNDQLWLTFRGSFMILGLLLIASAGMSFVLAKKKTWLSISLIGLYAFFVIPFLYHYFFSYPLWTTKDMFFYHRVVASYIQRQPDQKFILYGDKPLFDAIIAYNHLITKKTLPEIHAAYQTQKYRVGNLEINSECFNPTWLATQSGVIAMVDARVPTCPNEAISPPATSSAQLPIVSISSVIDSGGIFDIHHDTLCQSENLGTFISIKRNVFAVEKLANADFCQSFFTMPLETK